MKKAGYLGCDVSKGYCDFILLDSDENVVEKAISLDDNKNGKLKLKSLIDRWMSQGFTELYCGVESTGGYESNWYNYLARLSQQQTIHVAKLNPKGVKGVNEASLNRTVTDAVSAENIAKYLIHFPKKVRYNTSFRRDEIDQFTEGRQLVTYLKMLSKQKVQLTNQLEKLLYQHLSEVIVYCRHGIPGWLLRLLEKYSSAREIQKAGLEKIGRISGISLLKAKSILEKVGTSDHVVSPQIQHVISVTAKEILHKENQHEQEKQYLIEQYKDNEQVKLLTSFPGIGLHSAVILLLEIEDTGRFEKCKNLTSYFGVHPKYKKSGDGIWGNHMSKQGRSEIRSALFMVGLSAIRHNPILRALYKRFRTQGFNHYQAMGVVMHKTLKNVYGMLKNNTAFDIKVDQSNVEKYKAKQLQLEQSKQSGTIEQKQVKYRYSAPSQDAPISRRKHQQNKKENNYMPLSDIEKAGFLGGNLPE